MWAKNIAKTLRPSKLRAVVADGSVIDRSSSMEERSTRREKLRKKGVKEEEDKRGKGKRERERRRDGDAFAH